MLIYMATFQNTAMAGPISSSESSALIIIADIRTTLYFCELYMLLLQLFLQNRFII